MALNHSGAVFPTDRCSLNCCLGQHSYSNHAPRSDHSFLKMLGRDCLYTLSSAFSTGCTRDDSDDDDSLDFARQNIGARQQCGSRQCDGASLKVAPTDAEAEDKKEYVICVLSSERGLNILL